MAVCLYNSFISFTERPYATSSLGLIYNKGKIEMLMWDPPDFPAWSEVEKYYIWKKETASTDWQLYKTVETENQSIKVEDFKKKCDFMIFAAHNNGFSGLLDTVTEEENDRTCKCNLSARNIMFNRFGVKLSVLTKCHSCHNILTKFCFCSVSFKCFNEAEKI